MDLLRQIKYRFPAEFLKFRTISTTLTFRVGNNEVKNFRMIERHYFRNKLIRSYDFNFHFVMPNSTNTWEAVYDLPELSEAEGTVIRCDHVSCSLCMRAQSFFFWLSLLAEQDMIANPYEATSDSFYFVEDKLVMHNKAAYCYDPALPLP